MYMNMIRTCDKLGQKYFYLKNMATKSFGKVQTNIAGGVK